MAALNLVMADGFDGLLITPAGAVKANVVDGNSTNEDSAAVTNSRPPVLRKRCRPLLMLFVGG